MIAESIAANACTVAWCAACVWAIVKLYQWGARQDEKHR